MKSQSRSNLKLFWDTFKIEWVDYKHNEDDCSFVYKNHILMWTDRLDFSIIFQQFYGEKKRQMEQIKEKNLTGFSWNNYSRS